MKPERFCFPEATEGVRARPDLVLPKLMSLPILASPSLATDRFPELTRFSGRPGPTLLEVGTVRISRLVLEVDGGSLEADSGGLAAEDLERLVDLALVTGVRLVDRDRWLLEVGGGRLPALLLLLLCSLVVAPLDLRVTLVERSRSFVATLVERSRSFVAVRVRLEDRPRLEPRELTLTGTLSFALSFTSDAVLVRDRPRRESFVFEALFGTAFELIPLSVDLPRD
jgi:hypothetical protein